MLDYDKWTIMKAVTHVNTYQVIITECSAVTFFQLLKRIC